MKKLVLSLFSLTGFILAKSQDSIQQQKINLLLKSLPTIKFEDIKRLKSSGSKSGKTYKVLIDKTVFSKDSSLASIIAEVGQSIPESITKPPVILPSPSSAALVNMINENVDLYTGKTSVTIPIYSLKSGSIVVPITLQGTANAHKVNDIGTNVGMGFSLNTGGSITRIMKSLPDEFTGTISPTYNFPGYGYLHIKNQGVNLTNFDDNNPNTADKMEIIKRGNWNVTQNQPVSGWDLQPDEFYFNFGTYSGKFLFDQDGGINLIPQANLKITTIFEMVNGVNKITGFIALTEDGFKYEFGKTTSGNFAQAPLDETKLSIATSSMHYTYRAIVAYDNNGNAYFLYTDASGYGYPYWWYERTPYVLSPVPTHQYGVPVPPTYVPSTIFDFDNQNNNENFEYFHYPSTWHLAKITSPSGDWVSYSYASTNSITYLSDRSFSANIPDLAERSVSGIGNIFESPIRPLPETFNPDLIRYIYTLPAMQSFTESRSTINILSKKLQSINTSDNTTVNFSSITAREDFPGDNRLDYITVTNSQNLPVKNFSFNYNTIENTATESPLEQFNFFFSKSVYNYNQNATYIGMTSIPFSFQRNFPIPDYCRKRMFLTSVQESGPGISQPPYQFEYYNDYKLPYRTSTEQDYFGYSNNNPTRHPFVSIGYTYKYPFFSNINGFAPALGQPILNFSTLNAGSSNGMNGGNKNFSLDKMKSGVLRKIIYPTGGYKEFIYAVNGNSSAWNGLRVAEVKEFESLISTNPIVKNFSYGNFVNTDGLVLNYGMASSGTVNGGTLYFPTNRMTFSDSRVNPQKETKGATGGYDFAESYQSGNGKTKVEYSTGNDYLDITTSVKMVSNYSTPNTMNFPYPYPFHGVNSLDRKRGFPQKDYVYKQSVTTPLQYNEHSYIANSAVFGEIEIPELTVSKYNVLRLNPANGQVITDWNWHLYGKTSYTSGWYPLVGKKTRDYEQNGSNYIENIQEYEYRKYTYNNKDYLFTYQQKNLKNSRNEQTISYSKFPLDYNLSNTNDPYIQGMAYLLSKNILNAKVEQFSYKQDQNGNNKKYIGGLLNKYHPDKPMPKEIFKLKTNGLLNSFTESNTNTGAFSFDPHYNSEVNFPLYDANGRILEQHKTNDIKEAYIWDYGKAFPVAKAVNANNNDIAFSSFEADESGANLLINQANIIADPTGAFTGKKYYSLTYPPLPYSSQPITITISNPGKEYRLNFWYKEPINNQQPLLVHTWPSGLYDVITPFAGSIKIRNGWRYSEYIIPASWDGYLTLIKGYSSSTTYIDEFRFYPAQSQMTTYTFDPLIGMTSETDVNGKTTYYEYDALNRLAYVKNENKDIVKAICYNYAGQPTPCSVNIDPCASATRPVINLVTKTGSSGSNFIYSLDFTPSPNSTSCVIELTDITDQTVTLIPISCTSPATFQVPKFHQFSIVVISYTSVCPGGIRSLPYP